MKLLDVRLKPSSAILKSVLGEFTSEAVRSKRQQIVVARTGGVLELYAIQGGGNNNNNNSSGNALKLEQRIETRSILRDLVGVRLVGEKRDVLALSSDSGCLGLLDFDHHKDAENLAKVTAPFGKTGCRRATPGQHLASDPKGRAICVSATEKRKLYPDAEDLLHDSGSGGRRSRSASSSAGGAEGAASPVKQLAYYELDLGLNHVSRKWAVPVANSAYSLAALPGYADGGPSGVLVGAEDSVTWYHNNGAHGAKEGISCALPKRAWDADPSKNIRTLVTQLTVHKQKRNKFFGLCQTEVGDVFKIDFGLSTGGGGGGGDGMNDNDNDSEPRVTSLTIALLDTLPPSNALNISKKGLLFCPTEFGGTTDHGLYQFERIDLPDAPTMTTATSTSTDTQTQKLATFVPSHRLRNLIRIDGLDNLSPTTGLLVGELTGGQEVSPQIYALGGRGPSACLRTLRHGCSVTELAVSELPGVPGAIFTVDDLSCSGDANAGSSSPPLSKYIVVSFADATLVLSVGDTVEEVGRESGFTTNSPTLACTALKDGSVCQIHTNGVRHIQSGQALEWHVPGLNKIECASANQTQVMIALAGGEVIYFELDSQNGKLAEGPKRRMKADVCCLDVGVVETGRERSLFCAVGCRDSTIQIVSLEPGQDKPLTTLGLTTLQSRPNSVRLLPSSKPGGDLVLMVGLDDGSSLKATVDPITGAIGTSPTRRFLGARPVSVARIPIDGKQSLMLLSSRPWISRAAATAGSAGGSSSGGGSEKHVMAPLSYTPLDHGCAFSSEAVPEGVVATAGKTLRIVSIDAAGLDGNDDEAFNTNKVSLRYTPRQMTLLSASTTSTGRDASTGRKVVLAVVESDYNDYGLEEKTSMGFDPTGKSSKTSGSGNGDGTAKKQDDDDAMDMDEDSDDDDDKEKDKAGGEDEEEEEEDEDEIAARSTPLRGPIPPGGTSWGSCVRLVDPSNSCESLDCVEMGRNEAALCCASVRFHTRGGESLLAVGTVTGMSLHPLKQASSHVILYRVVDGERLQLLHKTTMNNEDGDGPVLAMAHFQGRLLVGIGSTLRLYEMGKRQLLRKCELKGLPTFVKTLQTAGDRAYFGDMMRSLHIVRYEAATNRLVLIANDPCPRPIVSQELLDFNTVAVGDKFGNISVLRLPRGTDTATVDLTGQRALWDTSSKVGSNVAKLETLCQYHVGEVVTSMTRSSLVAGVAESLIYVTVTGRIGALVPFSSREDVEFYSQLEEQLRTEAPRLTGRDPQSYRSYYAPVMHVIDGELCDSFINTLSSQKQAKIAERLDRSVGEIMKKLEDTRNSLL
eukprot:jgi/Psemu1/289664/fgenesh1_pg.386_\